MNTIKIMAAATAAALREALAAFTRTATVEAEYGEELVVGSVLTLAHHGARKGNPCPCLYDGAPVHVEAIGVSHVDLDTLGGILALQGIRAPGSWGFWDTAAKVDVRGPHRLPEIEKGQEVVRKLQAFWAWSGANRVQIPREGAVDVTEYVATASAVITRILDGDEELLAAGDAWAQAQASLDEGSKLLRYGCVTIRQAPSFVNHLYGVGGLVVVALNTTTSAVTVSVAEPGHLDCCKLVQSLWGASAGGHAGIAGSPRGKAMTLQDAFAAFRAAVAAVHGEETKLHFS